MKKWTLLLAFFGLLALIGYADSQMGIQNIGSAPVGKTFRYAVRSDITTVPIGLTFTGLGNSWLFSVAGGTASFRISTGQEIHLIQEMTVGGDFKYAITNPSMTIIGLQTGATAFMYIDGVN